MDFEAQLQTIKEEINQISDDIMNDMVEKTAVRLEGLNYNPPVITPNAVFLRLTRETLLSEIERIVAMDEQEACALAPGQPLKCQELRLQFISVLIYYYKKLVKLRKDDPEEWDEIDELYVHD